MCLQAHHHLGLLVPILLACPGSLLLAPDLAEVESYKFHEARGSDRRLNNFFQVGLSFRGNDSFLKSLHIGMHHFGADSRNDLQKSLEELKPNR